jgi:glycosyltransferase involved in cell wall biosynthesis
VDHAAFRAALPLRERARAQRPRIGYLGAIGPWFDFDLVDALATARSDWDIVLVGPVMPGAGPALERLASRPTVTVQPAVSHDDVPAVLAGFDVGLIPFRRTPLTAGVNPNKLYEYLAAGLAVVSTPFSAEVVAVPDIVARAEDAAAFAGACDHMLSLRRDDDARRRLEQRASELAAAHDWGRIAREFWACVCD